MGGFWKHGHTPLVGTIGSFIKDTYRAIIGDQVLPFINEKHGVLMHLYYTKITAVRRVLLLLLRIYQIRMLSEWIGLHRAQTYILSRIFGGL